MAKGGGEKSSCWDTRVASLEAPAYLGHNFLGDSVLHGPRGRATPHENQHDINTGIYIELTVVTNYSMIHIYRSGFLPLVGFVIGKRERVGGVKV